MNGTVDREDIRIEEEQVPHTLRSTISVWFATLHGRTSTGETVKITRSAATARGALTNLEAAIEAQGWQITEGDRT
ncbi:hypothetical protein [Microbacterium sp. UBA3394]|uniref:hypothetical protein n=1 Tax=Microbacterium sp. UBA3394 TaxID=1946945 RepID=UPI000C4924D4|nr:hypothetical protein [Microbacterium sp. UBA3394]MAM53557.1 hypothetical protein [Microbacterium sp.]|tara:strand:+ start:484 stop:711 length:228 start_codon:yes stop_codon:yes gene_type:complete